MKQGFVKVADVTPKIVVADTKENTALICAEIKKAEKEGAKIIVLPELCITGYTCGDLFLQEKCCVKQDSRSLRSLRLPLHWTASCLWDFHSNTTESFIMWLPL